jgi:hypothetical protein
MIKINLKAVWKLFYSLIRFVIDDFLPIVKNVPTSYYNMYLYKCIKQGTIEIAPCNILIIISYFQQGSQLLF